MLHQAAAIGHLKLIDFLIEKRKIDINAVNIYNETPLYFAYLNVQFLAIEYLTDKGANVYMDSYRNKSAYDKYLESKRNNNFGTNQTSSSTNTGDDTTKRDKNCNIG